MSLDDLLRGLDELEDARASYETARDYFDGAVPEVFASPKLRRAMEATGIDFRLNFAKIAVTTITDRVKLAAISSPDKDADSRIRQIIDDNSLDLEYPGLHRDTGKYGDMYMIVWSNPDDDSKVDMFVNDPLTVRIVYDDENPRRKAFAVKHWCEGSGRQKVHRANLYYADTIERWVTRPGVKGTRAKDWALYAPDTAPAEPGDGDGEDAPEPGIEPNPYGEVPVFHFRTDQPFGVPLHRAAYGPQNAINKLVITHMATVDYQGFPQRYALAHPDSPRGPDDLEDLDLTNPGIDFTDDDDTLEGGDSNLRSGPGELWYMQGIATLGQFNAADPATFTDPTSFYVRGMATVCEIPLHYFDPSGDTPSGESARMADMPVRSKTEQLELSLTASHRDAMQFGLKILGIEDAQVEVRWAPATTIDDTAGWQVVTTKLAAGVPPQQALVEAGYTAETVQGWLDEDDWQIRRRVELLVQAAAAGQGLQAVANLGGLDDQQVRGLLEPLLAEIQALTVSGSNA
jgi:hypothetical protein